MRAHVAPFPVVVEEAFRGPVGARRMRLHHAMRSVWGIHSGRLHVLPGVRCPSGRCPNRRCGSGAFASTRHGGSTHGRLPSSSPTARLPATRHASARPSPSEHARDASTRHAAARPPSARHGATRLRADASARHASARLARPRLPTPATCAECSGSPAQPFGHAASQRRPFAGQRHGQLRHATCRSIRRRRHDHRSQSCRFSHRCHREQLG